MPITQQVLQEIRESITRAGHDIEDLECPDGGVSDHNASRGKLREDSRCTCCKILPLLAQAETAYEQDLDRCVEIIGEHLYPHGAWDARDLICTEFGRKLK